MAFALQSKARALNIKLAPSKLYYGPRWIVLGVNNVCNLHCKMCDVGTKNTTTNFAQNLVGTHPMNMPLDLFKTIIDQTKAYAPNAKIGYAFTEPLVYPHLLESLEYADGQNMFTAVTTNALNLKKHADNLSKVGLDELYISLDGLQETHNFIRGHKSSFQRAIEGIEAVLKTRNAPKIGIYCVVTNWNQDELGAFAEYFQQFPLKELAFMHANFTSQTIADEHNKLWFDKYPATVSNLDEFNPETYDLDKLWSEIEKVKRIKSGFPIHFAPELHDKSLLNTFYKHPEVFIGKGCSDVFNNLMIKSDGSVIPAHGRCYNLKVGNIYEQSLKDIWNSTSFSEFRKDLRKSGGYLPACSRCCSAF